MSIRCFYVQDIWSKINDSPYVTHKTLEEPASQHRGWGITEILHALKGTDDNEKLVLIQDGSYWLLSLVVDSHYIYTQSFSTFFEPKQLTCKETTLERQCE